MRQDKVRLTVRLPRGLVADLHGEVVRAGVTKERAVAEAVQLWLDYRVATSDEARDFAAERQFQELAGRG